MESIAKHVRISPKKANLVAGLVRRKTVVEALDILKFTPKKAAKLIYKVVYSAMANAENNFKQKKENLVIKEIVVTEGRTLKRSVPVSRGRVHPILKRSSHIRVIVGVSEKEEEKAADKTEVKEVKKVVKKAEPKAKKTAGVTKKSSKVK